MKLRCATIRTCSCSGNRDTGSDDCCQPETETENEPAGRTVNLKPHERDAMAANSKTTIGLQLIYTILLLLLFTTATSSSDSILLFASLENNIYL